MYLLILMFNLDYFFIDNIVFVVNNEFFVEIFIFLNLFCVIWG